MRLVSCLALLLTVSLGACVGGDGERGSLTGGSGSGSGSGDSTGTPGGGGGEAPELSACQRAFDPELQDQGADCRPTRFAFCPPNEGNQFAFDDIPPCDGVRVDFVKESDVPESFSGTLDYAVLRPANAEPRALVVSLHFRQLGRSPERVISTYAAQMRMSELAKGRQVMVVLPAAPGGVWPSQRVSDLSNLVNEGGLSDQLLSGLDSGLLNGLTSSLIGLGVPEDLLSGLVGEGATLGDLVGELGTLNLATIDDFMDYIELALADARARFGGENLPVFFSGLSNGGLYALRFACERPAGIDAVMSVASGMGFIEGAACQEAGPKGVVHVHGRADPLSPYEGSPVSTPIRGDSLFDPGLFLDVFGPNNGCGPDLRASVLPAGSTGANSNAGDVTIERFATCTNSIGARNYMVTIENGGHNWPGFQAPSGADTNALGPISRDFDATLQGYDLMVLSAGLR